MNMIGLLILGPECGSPLIDINKLGAASKASSSVERAYFTKSYPALSYPALSHPILSYPILFQSSRPDANRFDRIQVGGESESELSEAARLN